VATNLTPLTIEDAIIIYRNFKGKEGQFNREGDRNFSVILPNELADQMEADGWNVKRPEPTEEGETRDPHIQVSVSYNSTRPPRVVMLTEGTPNRTELDEDLISLLDSADIVKVDLIINPYAWGPIGGRSGIKAYLKTMFVTIRRDYLEEKYDAEFLKPGTGTST